MKMWLGLALAFICLLQVTTAIENSEHANRTKRWWGDYGLGYGYGLGMGYGGFGGWYGKRDVDSHADIHHPVSEIKKPAVVEKPTVGQKPAAVEKPAVVKKPVVGQKPVLVKPEAGNIKEKKPSDIHKRWFGGYGLGMMDYGFGYDYPFYGGWFGKRDIHKDSVAEKPIHPVGTAGHRTVRDIDALTDTHATQKSSGTAKRYWGGGYRGGYGGGYGGYGGYRGGGYGRWGKRQALSQS